MPSFSPSPGAPLVLVLGAHGAQHSNRSSFASVVYTPGLLHGSAGCSLDPARERRQADVPLAERIGRGRRDTSKLQGDCGDATWPGVPHKATTTPGESDTAAVVVDWIVDFLFCAERSQGGKHT